MNRISTGWNSSNGQTVCISRPWSDRTYRAIIHTWNAAFFRYSGLPQDLRVPGTPDWAYVQWYGILHRLQFQQSVQVYAKIAELKRWWLQTHLDFSEVDGLCCILPCEQMGDYLRSNSMDFCKEHRGLSLIYGLRHVCNMCTLFSLLCLKTTGHDEGHQYNYLRRLSIPIAPPIEGDPFHAHVKMYCSDSFDPEQQDMVYSPGGWNYQYWEELSYKMEYVPKESFVYIVRGTKTVTAWVHVEVLRNEAWVPLRRHEVSQLNHILGKSSDVYRDSKGFVVPCAVRGQWVTGYRSYRTQKTRTPRKRRRRSRNHGDIELQETSVTDVLPVPFIHRRPPKRCAR